MECLEEALTPLVVHCDMLAIRLNRMQLRCYRIEM